MGNTTNPYRYSGEYFDEESGLIYLRNRYYNPEIGRFITEDPHWNIDNMIYGDNQKAVKYSFDGIEKVYYDKYGKIVKSENSDSVNFAVSSFSNIIPQSNDLQLYEIKRAPDINTILQSSNLYIYAINNPVKYADFYGESITLVISGVAITGTAIVKAVAYISGAVAIGTGMTYLAEHKKRGTTNPSNLPKHQKGQARKQRDAGGEKGDARRTPRKDKKK